MNQEETGYASGVATPLQTWVDNTVGTALSFVTGADSFLRIDL
jgi:hypothetical protein